MKKFISILAVCALCVPAFAARPSADRRTMSTQYGAVSRATMPKNQPSATQTKPDVKEDVKEQDMRKKEKQACINNNIGVGNTFVWASRYSNTGNYASMVEDTEIPENNTCFVRVELKSDDAKVSVSDIAPVYYEMGRNITCGAWTSEDKLEQKILDAKKSARTWGTVAGVVGGAGIGVGAMELFGNKLIGGTVQGQKALSGDELLRSQLAVLKEKQPGQFDQIQTSLKQLKKECESEIWQAEDAGEKPEECTKINYNMLLSI